MMLLKVSRLYLPVIFLIFPLLSFAQERCGISHLDDSAYTSERFEKWLRKVPAKSFQARSESDIVIPVVVHVIHNGEAIGEGANLSEEKILEQIRILNADFSRTNDDRVNTPEIFREFATDTGIRFEMARQDPEGLPTSGITRTIGNLSSYSIRDDAMLKANISWPQEEYLNIYVAELSGFLGWAQFPVANLSGLDGEFDPNADTDGLVIDYQYWGINEDTGGSFSSFGRTATHEMGHFLGLRHIWGDGGCAVDDFCDDTPEASGSTRGCPPEKSSCGSRDMIENYMDFTDDVCMNMFTSCQANRMLKVLENSPRRKSLLSSPALEEPVRYDLDLGIRSFSLSTTGPSCNDSRIPSVSLRNYGTSTINGFIISMYENNELIATVERNFTLSPLSLTSVFFPQYEPGDDDGSEIEFRITELTNGTDQNPDNNAVSTLLPAFGPTAVPYSTEFDNFAEEGWYLREGASWTSVKAAFETTENQALLLPYYNNDTHLHGSADYLISPLFTPEQNTGNTLSFYYAYAQNSGEFTDGLIVAVSTDCGLTFERQDFLFEKYGSNLETSASLSQEFVPISSGDWRKVMLDLSAYTGIQIRVAFIGRNGNGNNIYLDKFSIGNDASLTLDAAILSAEDFSIANCTEFLEPLVTISNEGTETINSAEVNVIVDGVVIENILFQNLNLAGGGQEIIIPSLSLPSQGNGTVSFEIVSVNGTADENPDNNRFITNFNIDSSTDEIPIREDFEENTAFSIVSTVGDPDWEQVDIGSNGVIRSEHFTADQLGKENWLVSPVLDVTTLDEASLSFKVSYAQRENIVDGLRVLVSVNCSEQWEEVIYNKRGSLLATVDGSVNEAWVPDSPSDWRTETADLTSVVSSVFSDNIRIAFVTTNGNGNNIYLDDIEIFDTQEPNLLDNDELVTVFPNPTLGDFVISLDLPEKTAIDIDLFDVSGKHVRKLNVPNALNQRLTISAIGLQGLYFVNIRGNRIKETKRILIGR